MSDTEPGTWKDTLLGGRPVKVAYRGQTGVDVAAQQGTPVFTPQGGTVVKSAFDGSLGHTVAIRMTDGAYLVFSHLADRHLKEGDEVDVGTRVGRSGASGAAAGPRLRVEVRTKASGGDVGNKEMWRFADPIGYLDNHGKDS